MKLGREKYKMLIYSTDYKASENGGTLRGYVQIDFVMHLYTLSVLPA